MNSDVDDILGLDFDPELLINLLEKLSLDNIPSDLTETLLLLESEAGLASNVNHCNDKLEGGSIYPSVYDPLVSVSLPSSDYLVPSTLKEEKANFCTSSDWSADLGDRKRSDVTEAQDIDDKISVELWNKLASDAKGNQKRPLTLTEINSLDGGRPVKKLLGKPGKKNNTFHQNTPIFSADCGFKDVFDRQGKVFDIQLGDFDSTTKLPFLFSDEDTSNDSNTHSSAGAEGLTTLEQNSDSSSNPFYGPDSGYDSACSNAVSPCALVTDADSCSCNDSSDDSTDDELDTIVAAIVEVENSLYIIEAPECNNINVPILKDSKNAEDHKEKILNFLKEPMSKDNNNSCLPFFRKHTDSPSIKLVSEDTLKKCFIAPVIRRNKKSPKNKKLKYDLKSAVKKDFRHSLIFTKGKHCPERDKILKQIQDDVGRAQKKVKIVQLIDKRLKRSWAADERENKRRRIQHKDV